MVGLPNGSSIGPLIDTAIGGESPIAPWRALKLLRPLLYQHQQPFPAFDAHGPLLALPTNLIDIARGDDPRIRNAWVRGSNPLCAPFFNPQTLMGRVRSG